MRKISGRKLLVAGVATAVIAGGAGAALAYWSTTGTGAGSASTSTGASDLDIEQTSTISGLAPGVAPQPISGTVANNASNKAYVNTVTVSIASVTGGAGSCDASDYTLANPTMSIGQDVPSGGTVNFGGATLAFNDKATNQDGCKGATVNLAYASN
jgi:hypothetical protein